MKRTPFFTDNADGLAVRQSHSRRGTTIIIAMVMLLILMAISAMLISCVVHSRTQFVREEQRLQTALMAEAGICRGVTQLRTDREFKGESWLIAAEQIDGIGSARVIISVVDAADASEGRIVSAAAEYPMGTANPIRITREIQIPRQEPSQ